MEETKPIENTFQEIEPNNKRRRDLLPWWMKVFCWLFMLFGIASVVALFMGLTDNNIELSFYGFKSNEPFSLNGLIVIGVGIIKGFAAYSLWFEKDYAMKVAKIDALLGIALCVAAMLIIPFFKNGFHISIRLELFLLAPYLFKLNTIQAEWLNLEPDPTVEKE